VVFADMVPDAHQRPAAEPVRQDMYDAGVAELGVGVLEGDGCTWTLMIDSSDGDYWRERARKGLPVAHC
jgi:hypothetical protein